jgi:hypothetical protein
VQQIKVKETAWNLAAPQKNSWETLSGWWLTYPSEKYESQLGL